MNGAAEPHTGHRSGRPSIPGTLALLPKVVIRPRRTARELLAEETVYPSLVVVLGFAAAESLLFLVSYLAGDYPPPPEELGVWIETWGEFAMLPFIEVAAESYRLAMALFTIPLMLAIWMLMSGSARLLSGLFGRGRVSFDQYLNLFGFSFFAFMIVAAALDFSYSVVFGGFVLAALEAEYGPFVRGAVAAAFPPVMYTARYGLGGVYNTVAAREGEGYSIPRTLVVGFVTLSWPTLLVTLLLR